MAPRLARNAAIRQLYKSIQEIAGRPSARFRARGAGRKVETSVRWKRTAQGDPPGRPHHDHAVRRVIDFPLIFLLAFGGNS
jgi:hypothetical protein